MDDKGQRKYQWNVPGEFMLQNHGMTVIRSPLQAQIVRWQVQKGDSVKAGDLLVILEAMKMEHEVRAEHVGRLTELFFDDGALVAEGEVLGNLERMPPSPSDTAPSVAPVAAPERGASILRADLQRVLDRHAPTLDANRAEAVAKRHALGQRTARENIADLCDPDSFMEYGALAVAAQRLSLIH